MPPQPAPPSPSSRSAGTSRAAELGSAVRIAVGAHVLAPIALAVSMMPGRGAACGEQDLDDVAYCLFL